MKISFLSRITGSIILIALTCIFILNFSSSRLSEVYFQVAILKCQNFATVVVNKTIEKCLKEQDIEASLLRDAEGNLKEFNTYYINSLLQAISQNIYETLTIEEKGKDIVGDASFYKSGMVSEIPFSLVFENPLIASWGPRIPVCFSLTGGVKANLNSKVSSFGLNNGLIELIVHVELTSLVLIPLLSNLEVFEIELPIYASLLEGEIPSIALGSHSIEGVNAYIYEMGNAI